MIINDLLLEGFRNYRNQKIEFSDKINLFVGDNAQGKTNIIEAIYICSYSKTYRTPKDIDVINFESDYYRITLNFIDNEIERNIEIFLDKNSNKQIKIDGVKVKKYSDIIGELPIVIFSPDDLNIVKGSPADRRKFIDLICCQISKSYTIHLQEYNKCLKIKNNILKDSEKIKNIEYIKVLNEKMSKDIKVISDLRKRVINELEKYAKEIGKRITDGKEEFNMEYISDFDSKNEDEILEILNSHIQIDIYRKNSVKGIQKDDIIFYINGFDAQKYGSQGQARTVLLTLRLANMEIIKEVKNTMPILLLDDIMSELDNNRVKYLFDYIKDYQSIITTTDDFLVSDMENVKVMKIFNGSLK